MAVHRCRFMAEDGRLFDMGVVGDTYEAAIQSIEDGTAVYAELED